MQVHKKEISSGNFSIRVGQVAPPDSVNLAYIGNKLNDESVGTINVTENRQHTSNEPFEITAFASENYILSNNSGAIFTPTKEVLITDIFTSKGKPLYYKYRLQEPVLFYCEEETEFFGKINVSKITEYEEKEIELTTSTPSYYNANKNSELYAQYLSNIEWEGYKEKFAVGETSNDEEESKIANQEGNNSIIEEVECKFIAIPYTDKLSWIEVYCPICGDKNTTIYINYKHGEEEESIEEIGSFSNIFEEVLIFDNTWPIGFENENKYILSPYKHGWHIIISKYKGIVESEGNRNPEIETYNFEIKIDSKATLDSIKELKTGIILIGDSIIADSFTSLNEEIRYSFFSETIGVYLDGIMPRIGNNLKIYNPHPYLTKGLYEEDNWVELAHTNDKGKAEYWLIDHDISKEQIADYDLIIIAGNGNKTFTATQKNNLEDFVLNGGKIWIDNCGESSDKLNIVNCPNEVSFTYSGTDLYYADPIDCNNLLENQYNVINNYDYDSSSFKKKRFYHTANLSGTSIQNMTTSISTPTTVKKVTLIERNKGYILVSSEGILKHIGLGSSTDRAFAVNILTRSAEEKWIKTPNFTERVYNISSLAPCEFEEENNGFPNNILNGYIKGHGIDNEGIVAQKKTFNNLKQDLRLFFNSKEEDTVKIYINKQNGNIRLFPSKDFYLPSDYLYFYTNQDTGSWTGLNSKLIFPYKNINLTIEGFLIQNGTPQTLGSPITRITHTIQLSAKDKTLRVGTIDSLLPEVADKSNLDKVYYLIREGKYINNVWNKENNCNVNLILENGKAHYKTYNGEFLICASDISETTSVSIQSAGQYLLIDSNDIALKIDSGFIQLREPAENDRNKSWFLRVKNGRFAQKHSDTILIEEDERNNGDSYREYLYEVPEYYRQIFNPIGTFCKKRVEESAKFINNNVIQVSHLPLSINEEQEVKVIKRNRERMFSTKEKLDKNGLEYTAKNKYWIDYPLPEISTIDGPCEDYTIDYLNGKVVFDNEPTLDIYASYSYNDDLELNVLAVDIKSGTIIVEETIDYTDEILVDYFYDEKYLEYKGYDDGRYFWHLDLNPAPGHLVSYPTVVNGEIVPANTDSHKLIGKTVFVYLLPEEQNAVRHCFSEREFSLIYNNHNGKLILLGKATIDETSSTKDLVIFDTRKKGGGLKEHLTKSNMDEKTAFASSLLKEEVSNAKEHYWDVSSWNGKAYQSQGVAQINIPRKVLKAHGGLFTNEEVENIVKEHIALGNIPVVDYTDFSTVNVPSEVMIKNKVNAELESIVFIPAILKASVEVI